MAVTVVVGGQFGSEGKGKVAQYLAKRQRAIAAIRVGGSNSGHTAFGGDGQRHILRHLPTAALLPDVLCVLGPGSYIDPDVLLAEIKQTRLDPSRLVIDENAFAIIPEDRDAEVRSGQVETIGSTGSGTGAAVQRRIARRIGTESVQNVEKLHDYLAHSTQLLRSLLKRGERVIIEGTQGFGLSVLHSPYYPYATSRDTSAAGAVSESGLSPLDVDQVVLVLRSYPIRVGGESGPLPDEVDWATVTAESGSDESLEEFTSVTGRLRRIGRFDPQIVRQAIAVNRPSMIVMNHIDYVDARCATRGSLTHDALAFIRETSDAIGTSIDLFGLGPTALVSRTAMQLARVGS
jgi:adenylosuccinate synthase